MAPQSVKFELPKLDLQVMQIKIVGDSPLICHAWSEKAKKAMLDKQMKKATQRKEAKNPERDFEESLYPFPEGGYGFPTVAFKSAMVGACRFAENIKMTELRGALHIRGELVKVQGEPTPREDMVRVGMGTADIRYRGEFKDWSAMLTIEFNAAVISPEIIVNLLQLAGFGVGVGEWRPERDGSFGRFHVQTEEPKA